MARRKRNRKSTGVAIADIIAVAREEFEIMDTPIYTNRVNKSIDLTKEEWWIGIYTNPDCRRGLLGYLPEGTSQEEIRAQAFIWMRTDKSIARAAGQLEAQGTLGSAASTIVGSVIQRGGLR